MNKYSFRILWSDEDDGYIVTSLEFPGLSAFGETEEEALAEAKIARELFIKDMVESGEGLPVPQTAHEFSGQTRLRLPKSLHRLVAELAANEGVSINQLIVEAISEKIGAEKGSKRTLAELERLFEENSRQRQTDIASIVWVGDPLGTQVERVIRTMTEGSRETTGYISSEVN